MADNEEAPLLGLRHRNETANGPLKKVSFAGGLEFFIDGKGYDDQPHINVPKFIPTQDDPIDLAGPPLFIDDEIQSATALGRLAYTMPSLSTIFNGMPLEAFSNHFIANGAEELEFHVKVANTADATDSACPEGSEMKCTVQFSMRYTPLLVDVSPNQVYFDQQLSVILNPMAANNKAAITSEMDPVVFIKLDGTRTDPEGLFDYQTRLSDYQIGSLKTRAGDQHPGKSVPEVRFRVGNAHIRETAKHCNFAGDSCWNVQTHPTIFSVTKSDGYITGGQEMTINGWGLKPELGDLSKVSIEIDGIPCVVKTAIMDKITCITGAAPAISHDGVSQPGSPGLTQTIHNSDNDA